MISYLKRRRTYIEWELQAEIDAPHFWQFTASTGVDAFALGISLRRSVSGGPWMLAIAIPFLSLRLDVWPRAEMSGEDEMEANP